MKEVKIQPKASPAMALQTKRNLGTLRAFSRFFYRGSLAVLVVAMMLVHNNTKIESVLKSILIKVRGALLG